ncbi:ribonuclease P protein component 1 [Halosimplex litoreum]|uniref:Ribonuclease P protein component 1 n=1 Tax=Halosimplex litoreum TaxID=1198301 RepID=A0A7T3FYU6_9EURY|nr:ribonuclease P protein component 1 [Halosimplex litoreum]QPV63261.1 ribonuclease P protein component 1 [Halosimplex litoreum]
MLTPETLTRHELVGLSARVRASDNPDLLGIEGRVVAETTNTLGIERASRVATVPKAGTTFEFELASGELVTVEGRRLVARPARRTEKSGDSKWR